MKREPSAAGGVCVAGRPAGWLGRIACALLCAVIGPAQAEGSVPLRVVGGLGATAAYGRVEEPFWTRELPRLSGGRLRADIVPFERTGVRGEDMLSLVKSGVVGLGTVLLSQLAAQEPGLAAVDLAGLNPDIATLRRNVTAWRPVMESLLRQRHGLVLLGVHAQPAQLLYCQGPPAAISALASRRVRTMGASQADLIAGLGARPVVGRVAEVAESLRRGQIDCAVAGALGGHALGLHHLTGHLHAGAVDWGLSIFVAHAATWEALPEDLRALLRRELPRVEAAIWELADAETSEGIACNTGGPGCRSGRPGRLALVPDAGASRRLLREVFTRDVLPHWLQRCGSACGDDWNRRLRAVTGIEAAVAR